MNTAPHSFHLTDEKDPHKIRPKVILKNHPEIRSLIVKNPYTLAIIAVCVLSQIALAYFMRDKAWWVILPTAYLVGAFFDHTLFVCIHECGHNLLFKNKAANIWSGMLANVPLLIPNSVSFGRYHLKHHSHQGDRDYDADVPYEWEGRIIHNRFVLKAIWLFFFPIIQIFRTARIKEMSFLTGWTIVNFCTQAVVVGVVYYFIGMHGLLYLLACLFFSLGLHPLGARWIQEHFLTHGDQETKSYYGPLNWVNLNMGYHNEHHDFPSIPWNKLPEVKKIGQSYYDRLAYHHSYTQLLINFLFSKKMSVYLYTDRSKAAKEKLRLDRESKLA